MNNSPPLSVPKVTETPPPLGVYAANGPSTPQTVSGVNRCSRWNQGVVSPEHKSTEKRPVSSPTPTGFHSCWFPAVQSLCRWTPTHTPLPGLSPNFTTPEYPVLCEQDHLARLGFEPAPQPLRPRTAGVLWLWTRPRPSSAHRTLPIIYSCQCQTRRYPTLLQQLRVKLSLSHLSVQTATRQQVGWTHASVLTTSDNRTHTRPKPPQCSQSDNTNSPHLTSLHPTEQTSPHTVPTTTSCHHHHCTGSICTRCPTISRPTPSNQHQTTHFHFIPSRGRATQLGFSVDFPGTETGLVQQLPCGFPFLPTLTTQLNLCSLVEETSSHELNRHKEQARSEDSGLLGEELNCRAQKTVTTRDTPSGLANTEPGSRKLRTV